MADQPSRNREEYGQHGLSGEKDYLAQRPHGEAIRSLLSALSSECEHLIAENKCLFDTLPQLRQSGGADAASTPAIDEEELPPASERSSWSKFKVTDPELRGRHLVAVAMERSTSLSSRRSMAQAAQPGEGSRLEVPATPAQKDSVVSSCSVGDSSEPGRPGRDSSVASDLHAEDHYEKLYELERAFATLCARRRSSISVRELAKMVADHGDVSPIHRSRAELRADFKAAVDALNAHLGINLSSKEAAHEISLDAFVAIMHREQGFYNAASPDVCETMEEIRSILIREITFRQVARATNTTTKDIHASRRVLPESALVRLLRCLEPLILAVIMLNAVVICISTDIANGSKAWDWVEASFTCVFVAELVIKLLAHGVSPYFLGSDMFWNIFDAAVVFIGVLDLVFTLLGSLVYFRNFTIARMLRFLRLTRLIRVLKFRAFHELALMINGLLHGFRTLVWAVIFLGFLLFTLGVLLTQTLGHTDDAFWSEACSGVAAGDDLGACTRSAQHLEAHRGVLFGNVFRSMFTVFRCFTDGCTSVDGTPLLPYIYDTLGIAVVLLYMVVILFVIFGLFNLIMAIFVENTIANAKSSARSRREGENLSLAAKLQNVIVMFLTGEIVDAEEEEGGGGLARGYSRFSLASVSRTFSGASKDKGIFTKQGSSVNLSMQITRSTFEKVIETPQMKAMLDDLDISTGPGTRQSLFDILDANCNGTLDVNELVRGLLQLRGSGDRGEAVACMLAIRSIQRSIKAVEVLGLSQQQAVDRIRAAQERVEAALGSHGGRQEPSGKEVGSTPAGGASKTPSSQTQLHAPHARATMSSAQAAAPCVHSHL